MGIETKIVEHVLSSLPFPRVGASMRRARRIRIGMGYRMDVGPTPDEWTGVEGYVTRVCGDGNDVEVETTNRGGVCVSARRITSLPPRHERDGVPETCPWEAVVGRPPRSLEGLYDIKISPEENEERFAARLVSPWCCSRVRRGGNP